ncbi:MAG: MFS transporter [Phycisphaerae bacterium]
MSQTNTPPAPITHTPAQEAQVVKKVMWRLIPFIVILYLMNYIDRVNISIAKLQMMDVKLGIPGFNDGVYAFGVSVFFIGYFLCEIPSNLIQEKVGPRRWIARIMISWGLISCCFMFTNSPTIFYILRFLLGVAEAGFFPGMILYLSYWVPARQRARAGALFLTSTAISGIIGNPLGGYILYVARDSQLLHPWQWLFLIEGIPTVLLGCLVLYYLTDYPKDAKWLSTEERDILTSRMAHERHNHPSGHSHEIKHAFTNGRVWLLSIIYMMLMFGFYVINYWTPTICKKSLLASGSLAKDMPGYLVDLRVGLLSAIPFGAAAIGMVIIGLHSDRTGERRWHVALSATLGAIGLALAAVAPVWFEGTPALVVTLMGLSIGGIGIWGTLGPFWTMPPHILTGAAAAAGIALVNSLGNLGGGFVGPNVLGQLREHYKTDLWGLLLGTLVLLIGAAIVLVTRIDPRAPAAFPIDPNANETVEPGQ